MRRHGVTLSAIEMHRHSPFIVHASQPIKKVLFLNYLDSTEMCIAVLAVGTVDTVDTVDTA